MISSSDDEDEGDAEAESRCGVIKSSPLKPVFFSPEPTNRTTPKSVRESAEKNVR